MLYEELTDIYYIVLSLGGGVQSSYDYIQGVDGEVKVDAAIFADTGSEPQGVYDNLEKLIEYGKKGKIKVPIYIVKRSNLQEDLIRAKETGERTPSMPLFTETGMLWRQCTQDYKIRPVKRKAKELMKAAGKKKLIMQLGISTDEFERMKPSKVQYITHKYPLIEQKLSRSDCADRLREKGFTPVKSACIACPFRGNDSWLEMKKDDPESYYVACSFDKNIRNYNKDLKQEAFVHRKKKPLDEALTEIQKQKAEYSGDHFQEECSGFCGC